MSEEYKSMPLSEYVAGPVRDEIETERQEEANERNAKRPLVKKMFNKDELETKDIAQDEADREVVVRSAVDNLLMSMGDEALEKALNEHSDHTIKPLQDQLQKKLGTPLTQREMDTLHTLVIDGLGTENAKRNKTLYSNTTYRTMSSGPGSGQGFQVPIKRVVEDFREDQSEKTDSN